MIKNFFKFAWEVLTGFFVYNQSGYAQPDDPEQKNFPLIRGRSDSWSQRQIDIATKEKPDSDKKV